MSVPSIASVEKYQSPTVLMVSRGEQHRSVAQILRNGGFRVIEAAGISHALDCVRSFGPRLVVVGEAFLPIYGPDFLASLRGVTVAPIVVVGEGGQYALVRALEEGADAYVVSSIPPVVFLARVRAMLRRYARQQVSHNGAA
jgi:DNA-binding response OmpR family regulator